MEEIKRNIKTFLGILNVGRSKSISHWDESNFKRAEQWSKYAEEVYKKLCNKSTYKNALCNNITQDNTAENKNFVFESLKNARAKMQRMLLQNPYLTSTQFSYVLNMYKVDIAISPSYDYLQTLLVDIFNISQTKGTFSVLSSIKDKLKESTADIETQDEESCEYRDLNNSCFISNTNNIQTTRDIIFYKCGKLLLKHLQKQEWSSHENELETELNSLIKKCDNGTEIILRMLLVPEDDFKNSVNDCKDVKMIQSCVVSWIIDKSSDLFIHTLYNCASCLRSTIISEYPQFCELYLNYLKLRGDDLCNSSKLKDIIEKEDLNFGSSYNHFIEHFKQLFHMKGYASDTCRKFLEEWRLECGTQNDLQSNFWDKIHSEMSS